MNDMRDMNRFAAPGGCWNKTPDPREKRVLRARLAIPMGFDEAVTILFSKFNEEKRNEILKVSEEDFVRVNRDALGMSLRATFDLRNPKSPLRAWFEERGIDSADDMSEMILRGLHRQLTDRPLYFAKLLHQFQERHTAPTFKRFRKSYG
jgi:hypothetical protein